MNDDHIDLDWWLAHLNSDEHIARLESGGPCSCGNPVRQNERTAE